MAWCWRCVMRLSKTMKCNNNFILQQRFAKCVPRNVYIYIYIYYELPPICVLKSHILNNLEDIGSMFLRNVCSRQQDCMASQPRRPQSVHMYFFIANSSWIFHLKYNVRYAQISIFSFWNLFMSLGVFGAFMTPELKRYKNVCGLFCVAVSRL
jgi:hypothetical protein